MTRTRSGAPRPVPRPTFPRAGSRRRAKGYRADEVGEHAGLADTSLTLALEPRPVRTGGAGPAPPGPTGASGDGRRASAELGRLGADLIVSRTVAAIKESR